MITKEQAMKLTTNDIVYTVDKNADGTPQRYRVNGKIKTWKTRPNDFKLPVKRGLYEYGYITQENNHLVFLNEGDAK